MCNIVLAMCDSKREGNQFIVVLIKKYGPSDCLFEGALNQGNEGLKPALRVQSFFKIGE